MKYKTVVIDHLNCLFSNLMYISDCCVSFAFRCITCYFECYSDTFYIQELHLFRLRQNASQMATNLSLRIYLFGYIASL